MAVRSIVASHLATRRWLIWERGEMEGSKDERLAALSRYQILDTPPEASFDDVTRLASEFCGTPYSAISFADVERQWFKSEIGLKICESPLAHSFCAKAISQKAPLIVNDALLDPRFRSLDYVAAAPGIRFYAGIQLRSAEGVALGVLCVLDVEPRPEGLTREQMSALQVLAHQIETQLELRRALSERDAQVVTLRQVAKRLEFVAGHDSLTSLPNRSTFTHALGRAIKKSRRDGTAVALMLIDVDHFKQINDSLGHDAGDALLRKFAENLASVVRSTDSVARIGGDEFAVLLTDLDEGRSLHTFLASMMDRLNTPLRHRGRLIDCCASVGIAVFPKDANDVEELTKCSDLALAAAKAKRGTAVVFEPALQVEFDKGQRSVRCIREALDAGALKPFYQPKVDLVTGLVVGFEALMRGELEGQNVSLPRIFNLSHLDANLMARIRILLTNQILNDVAEWTRTGVEFGHVAINSNSADFAHDNFAEDLIEELRKRQLSPRVFELEVTEGVLVGRGAPHVARALKMLCEAGMRIALDDFGTGFASLTHLKQFPVDVLKIDRSFVAGIGQNADDAAIVRAVIGLGKSLGIETVAEGIETVEQAAFVRQHGCDVGQGFLYGRAVPASKVPQLTSHIMRNAA